MPFWAYPRPSAFHIDICFTFILWIPVHFCSSDIFRFLFIIYRWHLWSDQTRFGSFYARVIFLTYCVKYVIWLCMAMSYDNMTIIIFIRASHTVFSSNIVLSGTSVQVYPEWCLYYRILGVRMLTPFDSCCGEIVQIPVLYITIWFLAYVLPSFGRDNLSCAWTTCIYYSMKIKKN